jgi:hypothetical protein
MCAPDKGCLGTSCLCDCLHLCHTSIISSVAAVLRLLDHEDGEMSTLIYQSAWHNIPEDLNLCPSRSNINTENRTQKLEILKIVSIYSVRICALLFFPAGE